MYILLKIYIGCESSLGVGSRSGVLIGAASHPAPLPLIELADSTSLDQSERRTRSDQSKRLHPLREFLTNIITNSFYWTASEFGAQFDNYVITGGMEEILNQSFQKNLLDLKRSLSSVTKYIFTSFLTTKEKAKPSNMAE